jgi:NitT/TauT family transport system substrate-binding protein
MTPRGCERILLRALLLACLVVMGSTAGCKRTNPANLQVVRIGYFATLSHAQALLGVASGELASAIAPVKLEGQVFNAGPSLIEALFAGEIDIGYVGPGPVLSANAQSGGRGIRVVAGAAANGVVIVARAGSGIHTIADIKNRRIATPQLGNTQDLSARHYVIGVLKQADAENVLPVPNAEQAGMFQRGTIDAAWVPEPWGEYLIEKTGATLVAEEKDLWPDHTFGLAMVVTTPTFLTDHPEIVEKVLRVHHAWTARLSAEPEKQLAPLGDALFALTGKRLPESVLAASLHRIQFTDDPKEDTFRSYSAWSRELALGARPGAESALDTKVLIDRTVLERVVR